MRSHSDGVRSDVYRILRLIGEREPLYNCKMHDSSSFNHKAYFLNMFLNDFDPPPTDILLPWCNILSINNFGFCMGFTIKSATSSMGGNLAAFFLSSIRLWMSTEI